MWVFWIGRQHNDDIGKVRVVKASSALLFTATVLASVLKVWEVKSSQTWRKPSYIYVSEFDCARDHSNSVSVQVRSVLGSALAHSLNVDLWTQNCWKPVFHGWVFTCLQIEICGDSNERAALQNSFNSELCSASKKIQFPMSLLRPATSWGDDSKENCCNPEVWSCFSSRNCQF